jgi:hypothetical protein
MSWRHDLNLTLKTFPYVPWPIASSEKLFVISCNTQIVRLCSSLLPIQLCLLVNKLKLSAWTTYKHTIQGGILQFFNMLNQNIIFFDITTNIRINNNSFPSCSWTHLIHNLIPFKGIFFNLCIRLIKKYSFFLGINTRSESPSTIFHQAPEQYAW